MLFQLTRKTFGIWPRLTLGGPQCWVWRNKVSLLLLLLDRPDRPSVFSMPEGLIELLQGR